ncbi:tetratricopeptide repeat protein 24-like isoform X1 [Malaclemys terrapin pileata]|uniref:tetratricopeptide repeat protein 24-like isoform X1 n=1 Tax=Malaclemys terrapin pileata TaxID=2991368 RepID=UPI0023A8220E|nr:tetratricopeptide repeat protein 24-like isoform X1 [Malaclemys terrapin pileata]
MTNCIACIQYKEMASTLVSSSSEVQTISHHPSIQDEILKLSKAGTTSLKNNEAAQALSMFKKAYILADGVPETQSQKMCLFNLGAAYIAMGKPKKGLKCLLKCKSKGSVEKDGDFYFNIAAAYDEMKEYSKAVKFYQRAISEYIPSETQSISDALIKLGYCSVNVGDLPSAARSFKLASHSYQKTEKTEDAAMAMREAVSYMIRSQKFSKAEVLKTLAECAQLCSGITNQDLLGKLYNHIGLHYAEMMCFHQAGKYFIKAMQICSGANFSIRKRAVLLQNLGAIYNALRQYEKSLRFHGEAAHLYGALRERNAQGQSLCNLAYAYSQLKNYDMAEYYYQEALNAFVDVGDLYGQQQVCEGLGATSFCLGDVDQAISYYKQALTLFGKSKETSDLSRERVLGKLRDAVKYQTSHQCPVSCKDSFSNTIAAQSSPKVARDDHGSVISEQETYLYDEPQNEYSGNEKKQRDGYTERSVTSRTDSMSSHLIPQ